MLIDIIFTFPSFDIIQSCVYWPHLSIYPGHGYFNSTKLLLLSLVLCQTRIHTVPNSRGNKDAANFRPTRRSWSFRTPFELLKSKTGGLWTKSSVLLVKAKLFNKLSIVLPGWVQKNYETDVSIIHLQDRPVGMGRTLWVSQDPAIESYLCSKDELVTYSWASKW